MPQFEMIYPCVRRFSSVQYSMLQKGLMITFLRAAAFLLVLFPIFVYSQSHQQISFEHISLNEGLSQSSVLSVIQDSHGFMWFATQEGLNKFDGYTFTIYKHQLNDPYSLSDDWINVIFEDREGNLWVGTAGGGLNKYEWEKDRFIQYQHVENDPHSLSNNSIVAIFEDSRGNLWIGTNGGGLDQFVKDSGQFIAYKFDPENPASLSSNQVSSICEDMNGNLWIGTADNGLNKFNPETGVFTRIQHAPQNRSSLADNRILSLYAGDDGYLWVGTNGSGADKLFVGGEEENQHESNNFKHYRWNIDDSSSLSDDRIYKIYRDPAGTLWFGTDRGLNKYLPAEDGFIAYVYDPTNSSSLSNDFVRDIYEDNSGILWVATFGGALNKFDKKRAAFINFVKNPANAGGLSDNNIWCITKDIRGNIWVGTNNGLNRINLREAKRGNILKAKVTQFFHQPENEQSSLSHNVIRAILQDHSGNIWIGTDGGGVDVISVNQIARDNIKFIHYQNDPEDSTSLCDDRIRHIFEDENNMIWICTWDGLNMFDRSTGRFSRFQHHPEDPASISDNRVRTIFEDHFGALWVGTYGGLNLFERKTGRFISFKNDPGFPFSISNDRVLCVQEDKAGRLWIGTYGGGLNQFNRDEMTFTRYTVEDGLPNNAVYGILEDGKGNLWLSTNKGISKFNPDTGTFKNYDENDGLQSNEFNGGAYYKSKSGMMFFGGINGFTMFYPDEVKENQHIPAIVLTDFKMYGKSANFNRAVSEIKQIDLSYKEDFFSFEFAALDFTNPEKNQYAYKLEGFDKDWIYSGNRHYASYTNLDGGDYTFRVKGTNNDGKWNEKGIAIKLLIEPPFWQTWWFRILFVLFFILLGYLIYRIRVRSIHAQKRKLEVEVTERTRELNQRNVELVRAKKETDDILNNVEEGLFLLNSDYEIGEQYSAALEEVFRQTSLDLQNIIKLLEEKVPENIVRNTREYLELMFRDDVDEQALVDLNPLTETEFQFTDEKGDWLNSKYLTFHFRRITEQDRIVNLIVTVEDTTEQVLLSKKLKQTEENTKKQMEWLVNILHIEPPLLNEFIEGVQEELDYIDGILRRPEGNYHELLEEMYRSMHIIKGNAALLDLKFFANKAHDFEEKIIEIRQNREITGIDFVPLVLQFGNIRSSLNEIKKFIERITQFHEHFRPKRSYESELLIKSLKNLIDNLSQDLGKEVNFVFNDFEAISIPYRYRLLIKETLIQLVRNSMYHGIESRDERLRSAKNPKGTVSVISQIVDDNFVIRFRDDGRGIQQNELRKRAMELGIASEAEVNGWDEDKLTELIFMHGVSTAHKSSLAAGRGVGMDAIRKKLGKFSGSITVESEAGKFCEFTITLPMNGKKEAEAAEPAELEVSEEMGN
ncbi:MAG: two-component regulator propeller domain-containing protein [Calditrichia bacterium]